MCDARAMLKYYLTILCGTVDCDFKFYIKFKQNVNTIFNYNSKI